ncbi:MAG: tRNA pseudouridine(55) synthase TruB [Streptosporangiales bacterium]|nr:tRNA pseudouridine(55) synthase TruB [Streptosporangiales bacterium]
MSAQSGLVIVDKPGGWTSHDVVARVRRLAGTRRVGHAGTLDPMATGVLVVGVERATRVLGHLALAEKAYDATIRLGRSTTTDDAEGEETESAPAGEITDTALLSALSSFKGRIQQIPPQVSAIKVGGKRSYRRVRSGENVELQPRQVTVYSLAARDVHRDGDLLDVDVSLVCSTGTYVRSLARDLGAALGVGGHLTRLRRTRVGPYDLEGARTLERLAEAFEIMPLGEAVLAAFPSRVVSVEEAREVRHGARLPAAGIGPGPVGVFGPDGELLALVEESDDVARPLAVFAVPG